MRQRSHFLWFALLVTLAVAAPASAQNYGTPTFSGGALGNVASAVAGQTVFRISSSTGAVTVQSGSGGRISTGAAQVNVTVSCGNQATCGTDRPVVTISSSGTPTGRAAALSVFTATAGTATFFSGPTGTNPVTITLNPIGQNATKSFAIGFDFPVNATGTTGAASSGYTVGITRNGGGVGGSGSGSGTATASVFRAITITKTADIAFGKIVRPSSGTGSVSLTAAGVRSVTGTGSFAFASPSPTSAAFSVNGEGGQAITVTIPTSFTMTSGVNSLTVTTVSTGGGVQTLSSSLGNAGTPPTAITVGGSFPISSTTPTGTYSGTFSVTVQYN
jgi:Domain of unknown function (DUF4402)